MGAVMELLVKMGMEISSLIIVKGELLIQGYL